MMTGLRSQHTSLGKILFTNGYYDFKESIFVSSELNGFDPNIVFYCRIDHDFTHFDDSDMEYIETIKHRLLDYLWEKKWGIMSSLTWLVD